MMPKFQNLPLLLNRIQNKLLAEYRTLTKPGLVKLEGIAIRVDDYFSEPIRGSIYRGHIPKLAIELHEKLIGSEKVKFVKAKLAEAGFQVNKKFSQRENVGLEQLFWERLK